MQYKQQGVKDQQPSMLLTVIGRYSVTHLFRTAKTKRNAALKASFI